MSIIILTRKYADDHQMEKLCVPNCLLHWNKCGKHSVCKNTENRGWRCECNEDRHYSPDGEIESDTRAKTPQDPFQCFPAVNPSPGYPIIKWQTGALPEVTLCPSSGADLTAEVNVDEKPLERCAKELFGIYDDPVLLTCEIHNVFPEPRAVVWEIGKYPDPIKRVRNTFGACYP